MLTSQTCKQLSASVSSSSTKCPNMARALNAQHHRYYTTTHLDQQVSSSATLSDARGTLGALRSTPNSRSSAGHGSPYLGASAWSRFTGPNHSRSLHASASWRQATSSPSERAQILASVWSRPHKPSQDSDDSVVPAYYIERKKQLDMIMERKEEEGGLMVQLSAGILSQGIAAQTRVREEKIPVEIREEDGVVRHPSGFEPPTPETDFHPIASKIATETSPLLTTIKIPWDEALAPSGPQ